MAHFKVLIFALGAWCSHLGACSNVPDAFNAEEGMLVSNLHFSSTGHDGDSEDESENTSNNDTNRIILPNMSSPEWTPLCDRIKTTDFTPRCLPAVLQATNDSHIFDFAEACGLHAAAFVHLNVQDKHVVHHQISGIMFHNLVVAVFHFLLGAMTTNFIMFRKRVKQPTDESPCLHVCFSFDVGGEEPIKEPLLDTKKVASATETEKPKQAAWKTAMFGCLHVGMDTGKLVMTLAMLILAFSSALTALFNLFKCLTTFCGAALELEAGFFCTVSLMTQATYFGDIPSLLTLSTFTIVDLIPLGFMIVLSCFFQCLQGCATLILCAFKCVWCCIKALFTGIWTFIKGFFCCIYNCCCCFLRCKWIAAIFNCCCEIFPTIYNEIVGIFNCCCVKAYPCVTLGNMICWPIVQINFFCCTCHWTCACICSQLCGLPVMALAFLFGCFLVLSVFGYAVVAFGLYVIVVAGVVFTLSALFIGIFWLVYLVMVVLSKPAAKFDKDLQFRWYTPFALDYLTKLINSLLSYDSQEALLAVPGQISDGVQRAMQQMDEIKQQTVKKMVETARMAAPAQQLMGVITVQLQKEGRTTELKLKLYTPFREQNALFGNDQLLFNGTKLDDLQTPAHYKIQEGDTINSEEISRFGYGLRVIGFDVHPPADKCTSATTGKPNKVFSVVTQAGQLSKGWAGGMILGPFCLMVSLGLSAWIPAFTNLVMVFMTGDTSWKLCGEYSIGQVPCNMSMSIPSDVISISIDGCSCLDCQSLKVLSDVKNKTCNPMMKCTIGEFAAVAHDCFGFHYQDKLYPAVDGYCDCEAKKMVYYPNKSPPGIYEPEFLAYAETSEKLEAIQSHVDDVDGLDLLKQEGIWMREGFSKVTFLVSEAFGKTVFGSLYFVITKWADFKAFLKDKFYKVENIWNIVTGWFKKELAFAELQLSVLTCRAVIGLAMGILSALSVSHRV